MVELTKEEKAKRKAKQKIIVRDRNDNIKVLYLQLKHKTKFAIKVADNYGLNRDHVRNRWFGGTFSTPIEKQVEVIEMLQNQIRNDKNL